jgi:hypothetical protein
MFAAPSSAAERFVGRCTGAFSVGALGITLGGFPAAGLSAGARAASGGGFDVAGRASGGGFDVTDVIGRAPTACVCGSGGGSAEGCVGRSGDVVTGEETGSDGGAGVRGGAAGVVVRLVSETGPSSCVVAGGAELALAGGLDRVAVASAAALKS